MPERQRGRDPNRFNKPERDPLMPEYHRATKFRTEEQSEQAYDKVRDIIKEVPCDVSTLRTLLLPDRTWHVLVFGSNPTDELAQQIADALKQGRATELPDDEWKTFNQRRIEQMQPGKPWVERRGPRRRLN